ncbi:hypothetical protein SCUP234_07414 [Seiridium cupressi]
MKLNFAIIAAAAFGISVMGAAIPEQVFHAPKSFTPAKNTDVPLNKKVEEPSDVVRRLFFLSVVASGAARKFSTAATARTNEAF